MKERIYHIIIFIFYHYLCSHGHWNGHYPIELIIKPYFSSHPIQFPLGDVSLYIQHNEIAASIIAMIINQHNCRFCTVEQSNP